MYAKIRYIAAMRRDSTLTLEKSLCLAPLAQQRKYLTNGVVVRASASQSVDLGFISQVESHQKTLKNGIHSFPAWRSAHKDSVENKPASFLVVSLGKALNGMPPSLCGRQMVRPSSLPAVVAQSDQRHANRASAYTRE